MYGWDASCNRQRVDWNLLTLTGRRRPWSRCESGRDPGPSPSRHQDIASLHRRPRNPALINACLFAWPCITNGIHMLGHD